MATRGWRLVGFADDEVPPPPPWLVCSRRWSGHTRYSVCSCELWSGRAPAPVSFGARALEERTLLLNSVASGLSGRVLANAGPKAGNSIIGVKRGVGRLGLVEVLMRSERPLVCFRYHVL